MVDLAVAGSHGTGSKPLPPHGWQRKIRRNASHDPRKIPCRVMASMAYWLHVGVKRQQAGNIGEMQS